MLTQLEKKYKEIWNRPSQQLMERAYHLTAALRERLQNEAGMESAEKKELRHDLAVLKRTVWFASWAPQYHENRPSAERLAESVIKLEREILGKARPKPLGQRSVKIQTGEMIDLVRYWAEYGQDAKEACRKITSRLQQNIQSMLEFKAAQEKYD